MTRRPGCSTDKQVLVNMEMKGLVFKKEKKAGKRGSASWSNFYLETNRNVLLFYKPQDSDSLGSLEGIIEIQQISSIFIREKNQGHVLKLETYQDRQICIKGKSNPETCLWKDHIMKMKYNGLLNKHDDSEKQETIIRNPVLRTRSRSLSVSSSTGGKSVEENINSTNNRFSYSSLGNEKDFENAGFKTAETKATVQSPPRRIQSLSKRIRSPQFPLANRQIQLQLQHAAQRKDPGDSPAHFEDDKAITNSNECMTSKNHSNTEKRLRKKSDSESRKSIFTGIKRGSFRGYSLVLVGKLKTGEKILSNNKSSTKSSLKEATSGDVSGQSGGHLVLPKRQRKIAIPTGPKNKSSFFVSTVNENVDDVCKRLSRINSFSDQNLSSPKLAQNLPIEKSDHYLQISFPIRKSSLPELYITKSGHDLHGMEKEVAGSFGNVLTSADRSLSDDASRLTEMQSRLPDEDLILAKRDSIKRKSTQSDQLQEGFAPPLPTKSLKFLYKQYQLLLTERLNPKDKLDREAVESLLSKVILDLQNSTESSDGKLVYDEPRLFCSVVQPIRNEEKHSNV